MVYFILIPFTSFRKITSLILPTMNRWVRKLFLQNTTVCKSVYIIHPEKITRYNYYSQLIGKIVYSVSKENTQFLDIETNSHSGGVVQFPHLCYKLNNCWRHPRKNFKLALGQECAGIHRRGRKQIEGDWVFSYGNCRRYIPMYNDIRTCNQGKCPRGRWGEPAQSFIRSTIYFSFGHAVLHDRAVSVRHNILPRTVRQTWRHGRRDGSETDGASRFRYRRRSQQIDFGVWRVLVMNTVFFTDQFGNVKSSEQNLK